MPTPTYDLIASTTLAAATTEVLFGSLPATYRDLVVVLSGINTTDDVTWSMKFNSDSGANYNYVVARGLFSTTVSSNTASSQTSMFIAGWSYGQGTTNPTPVLINIINRFQTQRNNGEEEVGMLAGRWASTSAITSISLFPNSSTLKAGTTASLYGIAS